MWRELAVRLGMLFLLSLLVAYVTGYGVGGLPAMLKVLLYIWWLPPLLGLGWVAAQEAAREIRRRDPAGFFIEAWVAASTLGAALFITVWVARVWFH